MNKDYLTHLSDQCGAIKVRLTEGKGKDMDIIIVNNGVFSMYLLPDRGLDIFRLEYKGQNVSYISPNGAVNPHYLGSEGNPFLSTFQGGFLLTCGLDNVMGPEVRNGKNLVQHGSYTYLPATQVETKTFEDDSGNICVSVSGLMEMTSLFGSRLSVRRTICMKYGEPSFSLKDQVINEGNQDDEYMIMYHHNIGYPLFNEHSVIKVDKKSTNLISKNTSVDEFDKFDEPLKDIDEMVYLHTINSGDKEHVSLGNDDFKLSIEWDSKVLPYMVQWKCMQANNYASGLEPAMSPYPKKEYRKIHSKEEHTYSLRYLFSDNNN